MIEVTSIKELEKILKLCRRQGVTEITTADFSFKLGELPTKQSTDSIEEPEEHFESVFDQPLTNEELVAYSNGSEN